MDITKSKIWCFLTIEKLNKWEVILLSRMAPKRYIFLIQDILNDEGKFLILPGIPEKKNGSKCNFLRYQVLAATPKLCEKKIKISTAKLRISDLFYLTLVNVYVTFVTRLMR